MQFGDYYFPVSAESQCTLNVLSSLPAQDKKRKSRPSEGEPHSRINPSQMRTVTNIHYLDVFTANSHQQCRERHAWPDAELWATGPASSREAAKGTSARFALL